MKTVFLIGFLPNPRIYKRIALAESYSDIHLICWDRGKEMMLSPEDSGIPCSIIKQSTEGNYLSRFFATQKFKKQALKALNNQEPDIIHVQHLDMLQIACEYKKMNKDVHIIYEVADLHRLLVDEQRGIINNCIQKHLRNQDIKCSQTADILIITSQKYYETYFCNFVPRQKVFYFPNVPDLTVFKNYKPKDHMTNFTVGFLGGIRYKEEMKLLINSVCKYNISLIVAGFEQGGHEIEDLCKGKDNIQWLGKFDYKESAAILYGKCDCIYSVYDAGMANCKVALPNKLYEAVYCELPIIVAADTFVGELVQSWNVGIPVIHNSQKAVDKAILDLMNPHIYNQYVEGCRNHREEVDLEKYNSDLKSMIMKLFY